MEEIKKARYRAIRWLAGVIFALPFMVAYSLFERRVSGTKKWVVVLFGGAVVYGVANTKMPTIYTWLVLFFLVAVVIGEWLSLPAEEKTWW